MIVSAFFEGDADLEIAKGQHDVYDEALGIIISTTNHFARIAIALLDDRGHQGWGQITRCDDRSLQAAHDLLAAVWRFKNAPRQSNLSLNNIEDGATPEKVWLNWLRYELSSWIDHPSLVRFVQLILANQNQPLGYEAESRLCIAIMDKFSSIPWRRSLRAAHEQDLLR